MSASRPRSSSGTAGSRRLALAAALAASLWAAARPAGAQMADLNAMARQRLRGRYASPVVCEGGGSASRAIRRLVVSAGPRHARPPVDRISFHGIDVVNADRCADVLGVEQPEVRGTLDVTLPGTPRPDLAQAEFQRTLRLQGGFDFAVSSGKLQLRGWGPEAPVRVVDFAGGTARVREVAPGSDAARILADLEGPRKLSLELAAPGGESLAFQLVLYDVR
jgi:hypothetical protein